MRLLDHPNVISLKHCFFSTTEKDELYLNLVLEYVPETVHRVIKHYNKMNQRMPMIYVKLYSYQVRMSLKFYNLCNLEVYFQSFCLQRVCFSSNSSYSNIYVQIFCHGLAVVGCWLIYIMVRLILFVFWQIFRALAYIHGSIGVCHRDIKPQNLLVSSAL